MNAQLQAIIKEIQGMRDDLDELEVKLARNDVLRQNIDIRDDYEMVASLDHLEPGGFKP